MINRYHTSLYCKIFTVSLQTIISNLKWSEGVATTNCTSIPQLDSWCICVCFRCYIYKCVFFFRVGMAWWIQFSFFFFARETPPNRHSDHDGTRPWLKQVDLTPISHVVGWGQHQQENYGFIPTQCVTSKMQSQPSGAPVEGFFPYSMALFDGKMLV